MLSFRRFLTGAAWLLLLPLAAQAHEGQEANSDPLLEPEKAIAKSQAAIGRVLGPYRFQDEAEQDVLLSDYRGRPLVIALVFTACSESCPLVIQSLAAAVEVAQDGLGAESFAVATIGFDSVADSPARMRAFSRSQGIDLPNWRFLSGDHANVDGVIENLGFSRLSSPRGFDHIAQVSVIDPEGRISAQIYGSDFAAPALVEPLKQLLLGQALSPFDLSGVVDRVRLFCTFFDARAGRYAVDYSFVIAMTVGGLALLGLAAIIIRAVISSRRPPGHTA